MWDEIAEEAIHTVSVGELPHEHNMQTNTPLDISISEDEYMGEVASNGTDGISVYSSVNSITQEVTDIIDTEGGWK